MSREFDDLHSSFLALEAPKNPIDPRFGGLPEFEDYLYRIGPKFPNIPRDAFDEWIYPFWHWNHIQTLYGYLDFSRLIFDEATWSLSECLNIQWYSRHSRVEGLENSTSTLGEFLKQWKRYSLNDIHDSWKNHGTWLKPIWVLDAHSFEGQNLHPEVKLPYMLIEGHSRLGMLRLSAKEKRAALQHSVWVVRCQSTC